MESLGLYSLHRRELRGDLFEAYKILTGKENINSRQLFQKARTTDFRGHSLKLYKKRSPLDVRKYFFSQRIVDYWNMLPDDLVTSATTSSFKIRLDIWIERYRH